MNPADATGQFWHELGHRHLELLDRFGREHFKRTVNQQYFNWSVFGILRYQFTSVIREWLRNPTMAPFYSRIDAPVPTSPDLFHPTGLAASVYRLHVAMLAASLKREDPQHLLEGRLEEPEVGDPVRVRVNGVALSQDLCHSVHEYYRLAAHMPADRPATILEMGAGYGRLAYVVLSARPDTRYIIVDIRPARDLAAWYLSTCLPGVSVHPCREDASPEELQQALQNNHVVFLAPQQLKSVPRKSVDVAVSISSLHEMAPSEIAAYFVEIDRVTAGAFYTKQWRVSTVQANGAVIRETDYPVHRDWLTLYHRRHPYLPRFFEGCYRIS